MYNFKMLKKEQEKIISECNFSDFQKFIFEKLVINTKRKDIYLIVKEKYGKSPRTIDREIKKIRKKIEEYNNDNSNYSYKVYIHKFPNGKKYVGVCQCCEDRWRNGLGYIENKEMYEDIKKYGWQNIEHKVLIEINDSIIAYKIEKILINELDLIKNGYNKTDRN